MVSMYAIKSFDMDVDDDTNEVTVTIIDGRGKRHSKLVGKFKRNESFEDQKKHMQEMIDKSNDMRVYFLAHGHLPVVN